MKNKICFYDQKGKKCGGMAAFKAGNAKSASLFFYGDIINEVWERWSDDEESKAPKDVLEMLSNIDDSDELDVYINSNGGSVFAGISIYNILKRHKGQVNVIIDGIAASIASVIAMAGDTITMHTGSTLMIHKPSCMLFGNSEELRKTAETLDILQENIIDIYETKLKNKEDREKVVEMVNAATYLSAKQSQELFDIRVENGENITNRLVEIGFIDEIPTKAVKDELTEAEKILMGA